MVTREANGDPEPDPTVPVLWDVLVAIRCTCARWIVVSRTAANNAPLAIFASQPYPRVAGRAVEAVPVAIFHPLRDVPVNVMEQEGVRHKASNWDELPQPPRGAPVSVGGRAVDVRLVGADRGAEVERRRRSRARRIFPFRLTWQAVSPSGRARQPRCISFGVPPVDVNDGALTAGGDVPGSVEKLK